MSDLLNAGLYHHSAGRSTIAVNPEKKPYHAGWNRYFKQAQTEPEIMSEFSNGAHGIALVLYPACDRVALDYDGPHAIAAWQSTGIQIPETARHITGQRWSSSLL